MNRLFNKRNINILAIVSSIILYVFIMFFSDITLDTGKKELENIIILAIPCFMLLFYSFSFSDVRDCSKINVNFLWSYN